MKYLLLALPLLLAACGADDADANAGSLRIEAQVEPDPPRVGQNSLHLQVHDADGAAVEGATIRVELFMPIHGHGSTETPAISELGGGAYRASPVTVQMPGTWDVTIRAEAGGDNGELVLHWDVK